MAAWTRELIPSSRPLFRRLACQAMMPSQYFSTSATKSLMGWRRERFAPWHQLLTATVGEDDGVTQTAAVREGRRPRPGVPDGALVVGLAV